LRIRENSQFSYSDRKIQPFSQVYQYSVISAEPIKVLTVESEGYSAYSGSEFCADLLNLDESSRCRGFQEGIIEEISFMSKITGDIIQAVRKYGDTDLGREIFDILSQAREKGCILRSE
jgi:hypothetical protein